MDQALSDKYALLKENISSLGSLAVAFSGGVDSALLLYAAKEALGDRAIAVTASMGTFPARELDEAKDFCRRLGVRQFVVPVHELEIEGFAQNSRERCYFCKKEIFRSLMEAAAGQGIHEIAEGSNLDDEGDYRPGLRAVAELGVRSPLRAAAFTKKDIREASRELGLPVWDKPSYACLASRFPYGETISADKLLRVGRAEEVLLELGFRQMRVRSHGDIARIELEPEDFDRFMGREIRERVDTELKKLGFAYVTLDLKGYRTGSMNEVLVRQQD